MRSSMQLTQSALALAVGLCAQPRSLSAQDYQGLTGSLAFGGAHYELAGQSYPMHLAGGLNVGYRFRVWVPKGLPSLSLTPHVALTMTKFGGISLNSSQVAFSRAEYGLQVALGWDNVRPYLLWRGGSGTAERMVNGQEVNYFGKARGIGAGIEIPARAIAATFGKPPKAYCDNAIDVQIHGASGEFTSAEFRGAQPPAGGKYSFYFLTVGWTGRFRGTRTMFTCR